MGILEGKQAPSMKKSLDRSVEHSQIGVSLLHQEADRSRHRSPVEV